MAIGNYEQLQEAIRNELKLSGGVSYTDRLPEWIQRGEAKANRKLRVFRQQKTQEIPYTNARTTRRVALPADFIEPLDMAVKESGEDDLSYVPVEYVSSERISSFYTSQSGKPLRYTVRRSEFEFDRKAGTTDLTLRIHYVGKWDLEADDQNWLLANHPDIYLYGALVEAERYNFNDSRAKMWKQEFNDAISQLNLLDERTRDDAQLDTREIAWQSHRFYNDYEIVYDD